VAGVGDFSFLCAAALRSAISAPILPTIPGAAQTRSIESEALQLKRADDRARAALRSKYREYQAAHCLGPESAMHATETFFVEQLESRARRGQERDKMPIYSLGPVARRRRAEQGERLKRM